MPIKIIRVPRDRGFASALPVSYQDPRFDGCTVSLTKAFVNEHFGGRRPSEIIVVAWVDDPDPLDSQ